MRLLAHPPAPGTVIPPLVAVRQRYARPRVSDVALAVARELDRILPEGTLRPGSVIGVTAGSRGIDNIASIIRAAVDFLRGRGVEPFILPAMGSHGGGTAEGQRRLIEHYGITEAAMGAPIRASVETVSLGRNDAGVEVFLARSAIESDGVLLLNRVKPHTDYKGDVESGLSKICAIGLGKLDGARELHGHLFRLGLGNSIRGATEHILASGKIIGGLAIVENAYHETAALHGVRPTELFDREREILLEAKALMGRLPFDEIDLLVCDRMGKNISGTGLDTNIIGRSIYGFEPGTAWVDGMPAIWRIVVDGLSEESEGNGVGVGLADFITERCLGQINFHFTTLNAMTGRATNAAKIPMVCANSRDAILSALATAPTRNGGPIVVYIRDTLALEEMCVSPAGARLLAGRSDIEFGTSESAFQFDDSGNLVSPFRDDRGH